MGRTSSGKTRRGAVGRRRKSLRVMFLCVGRRVELVNAFRRAAEALDIRLTIHGTDISDLAPAMHAVDRPHIVPRFRTPKYIPTLLNLVRSEKTDLVIPLVDPDLLDLAESRDQFEKAGATLVISSAPAVRICRDKILTFKALRAAGVDTPETWTWRSALRRRRHTFPYFMKPREGSAGIGNHVIETLDQLRVFGKGVPDPIVQEFIEGVEHTLDVYTGLDGVCRSVVPRQRIEVRSGEVSKGRVVKDERVISTGKSVVEALGEVRGVVTVQCMVTEDGRVRAIEINPRFGGGAPLGIAAGADYPKWLMADYLGRETPEEEYMGYSDGMLMLRYDESVFLHPADRRGGKAARRTSTKR